MDRYIRDLPSRRGEFVSREERADRAFVKVPLKGAAENEPSAFLHESGCSLILLIGVAHMMEAPPALLNARVLEYAVVDDSVQFTGTLHLYSGEHRVGSVSALAICEEFSGGHLLLVHCGENWDVVGVQTWNAPNTPPINSIDEIKERAEQYYCGISGRWIKHTATREEAEAYWADVQQQEVTCSFCGRGPQEVQVLIEKRGARICGECISSFFDKVKRA